MFAHTKITRKYHKIKIDTKTQLQHRWWVNHKNKQQTHVVTTMAHRQQRLENSTRVQHNMFVLHVLILARVF